MSGSIRQDRPQKAEETTATGGAVPGLALSAPRPTRSRVTMKEEKTMTTYSVEGDLLPDVIENSPPAPLTLFGNDPQLALQRMADLATELVNVVRDRKMFARISGRE